MKTIFLGALLSTAVVAQYPAGFIDFRSNAGKGTGKTPFNPNPKPGQAGPGKGSGPYKAKHFGDMGLAGHTIFQPVTPPTGVKMPVLIYANNGALAVGTIDSNTVSEIASYGYFVIVDGDPSASILSPGFAKSTDGFDAINWVVDQVEKGKLPNVDKTKIFAGGTSMGGMQSYTTSQDKRVLGTLIISSGLFGGPLRNQLSILTKPVGFFEGGTSDTATANGRNDYQALKVPTTWANGNFGHGQVNINRARAIIAWLDWQAKGNATAGKLFTAGKNAHLRDFPGYTEIDSKGFS